MVSSFVRGDRRSQTVVWVESTAASSAWIRPGVSELGSEPDFVQEERFVPELSARARIYFVTAGRQCGEAEGSVVVLLLVLSIGGGMRTGRCIYDRCPIPQ